MNKEEENKLSDAIITLHQEIKGMRGDMDKQLAKVNLAIGELRLSYMKSDESFNAMRFDFNKYAQEFSKYAQRNDDRATNHETRIERLEEKTQGNSYIVSEPASQYKTRRTNVQRVKRKKRK